MEHAESIQTNAAERYLLDEMPDGERDAFEDHYFDCTECARDVRDGARMMAAGREVVQEPPATVHPMRTKRSLAQWIPQAAAAGIIGGVMGWYGAINTGLQRVATIEPAAAPYAILTEAERGPGDPPVQIHAATSVILNYGIPTRDEAASYVSTIRDGGGKTWLSTAHTRDQAADPIVLIARDLPRGSYQVVIEGVRKDGKRFPISTSPFEVVQER